MITKAFLGLLAPILMAFLLGGCATLTGQKASSGRMIDPIVSIDWLRANRHQEDIVIIDIRSPADYADGHISNSINEPFVTGFTPETGPTSNWIVSRSGLWLELPDADDLFRTIGNLGITRDSRVVIVTAPNPNEPPFFGLANATRVGDTLIYAGVKKVAILDGGYSKWVSEGQPVTKQVPALKPAEYQGQVKRAMFVPIDDVKRNIGKAVIIDARDSNVYSGGIVEPFADKPGHIPSAESLPAPWIWNHNPDGTYTYKDPKTLGTMASGVIGQPGAPKGQGIIVYCGVGGYASSWWFVLTQVLGYQNVRIYDGAAQEWAKHYDMVTD